MSDGELQNRLARLEKALANAPKHERRLMKRELRAARREARRQEKLQSASPVVGAVYLVAAVAFVLFGLFRPAYFWMIFVGLSVGLSGAKQFRDAATRRRLEQADGTALPEGDELDEPAPPKPTAKHEVDALCDQLLADLNQSPEAVRSFVSDPERTVETLRKAARALDGRRLQLLHDAGGERVTELERQRLALVAKRDGTQDAEARRRLDTALTSLDGQHEALRKLKGAAERVDGEYTSLVVLLQELRTKVAVAKTAGGTGELVGLKQSVQRLNSELEAITDALDQVQGEGVLPPVAPISSEGDEVAAERQRDRA